MNNRINIQVDLSRLEEAVNKIVTEKRPVDMGNRQDKMRIELERAEGVEIDLNDLETRKGLLHYKGMQVVLFIPVHSWKDSFNRAVIDGSKGNKFHIAQCETLDKKQQNNTFRDRYAVSRNPDGQFEIYGNNDESAVVELRVCQNCLKFLNYKGANGSGASPWRIAQEFDINEFFANYSSLFNELPRERDHSKVGYTEDWPKLSKKIRQEANHTCESCNVDLSSHKDLLHAHHKNRVKSDNQRTNLAVLCADCHRKQPCHECMHVSHASIQLINRLRLEQGIITSNLSWSDVFRFADPAIHGALHHAREMGFNTPPEVNFALLDKQGKSIKILEAAWTDRNVGIYIGEPPSDIPGWKFYSIQEALHPKNGLGR